MTGGCGSRVKYHKIRVITRNKQSALVLSLILHSRYLNRQLRAQSICQTGFRFYPETGFSFVVERKWTVCWPDVNRVTYRGSHLGDVGLSQCLWWWYFSCLFIRTAEVHVQTMQTKVVLFLISYANHWPDGSNSNMAATPTRRLHLQYRLQLTLSIRTSLSH